MGAQRFGVSEDRQDALPVLGRQAQQGRRLDVDRVPAGAQRERHPRGGADQPVARLIAADADQDGIPGRPDPVHRASAAVIADFLVDALGGPAQGQFAQREQVAFAKEVAPGPLGLPGQIDLAFAQALQQLIGCQIDEDDLVGLVEDVVGNGLEDAQAGDLADDIADAVQVLDIDGRKHVDAGGEQLFDVLPAPGVAGVGRVAVREFVDEDQLGFAGQRRVEVEFGLLVLMSEHGAARQHFKAAEQLLGLWPTVGLDQADENVYALVFRLVCGGEHRIGFADAGAGAEEDAQLATPCAFFFLLDVGEQGIRIRTVIAIGLHGKRNIGEREARRSKFAGRHGCTGPGTG